MPVIRHRSSLKCLRSIGRPCPDLREVPQESAEPQTYNVMSCHVILAFITLCNVMLYYIIMTFHVSLLVINHSFEYYTKSFHTKL